MSEQSLLFAGFGLLMVIMLSIDLGMNRTAHEVSFRQALVWSTVWISLALTFNVGIYLFLGQTKVLEFLTGYIIEKSLSVDNLFVFIMIFSYFKIRGEHQARILKWGIIGALVLRALYFLLASIMGMFVYLNLGISAILAFVGGKMIATAMGYHIPVQVSLLVIFTCLALAILASLFIGKKQAKQAISIDIIA